jgi:serine protease AprX
MKFIYSSLLKQITFLFLTSLSAFAIAQNNEKAFLAKAKPDLISDFNNGKNEFWIMFNEQADVSDAKFLNTKEEKGEYVYKKLTETANKVQPSFHSLLDKKNVAYQTFWIVNAIYVKGGIELAKEIAAYPEVKELLPNVIMHGEKIVNATTEERIAKPDATSVSAIEWGLTKVKAPSVWALGYKGQGVVVSGEDTGYDWTHAAIKKAYRGWNGTTADHNYNWHDAVHSGGGTCGADSKQPCDDQEHGTHTMGTMVGDDGAGHQIGMAPSARWIGCRNMNVNIGTPASYIECFQWLLSPTDLNNQNATPSKAPHVINNSWGCDASEGCNTSNFSNMEKVVNNLVAAGIVVVVSAGNSGSGCNTINTPAAIYEKSFVVGSTTSSDAMSNFSSRGNVSIDGSNRIKPDVCAPGSGINSSVPGGSYQSMDGTSMAGPHVAGAVALLISAAPGLAGKVDSIERILEKTAVRITTSQTCNGTSPTTFPNNTVGHGRIDILAAVNYVLLLGTDNYASSKGIVVYPSPATDKLFAIIENVKDKVISASIYNTTGQVVFNNTILQNNQTLEIPVSSLPAGVYMYSINAEGLIHNGKFVKE